MRLRHGCWRLLAGAVTLSTGGALALGAAPVADAQAATAISLYGVSCAGAAACEAVGSYTNSSGVSETLAEVWNGTKWAVQKTPNPSGGAAADLAGVSCTGAAACEAVGSYTNSSGDDVTLAEVWNGTKWAIQATPNPSGSTIAVLGGVSCTGAAACETVGTSFSPGVHKTLAEVWNGTKWAIQATPNPSGTVYKSIDRVSCTGAGACEAVGFYTNSSDVNVALAEAWNGTKWAIQKTPNPSGTAENLLGGVSCTGAAACEAVGSYTSSGSKTLAEVWNGTKWAVQATPNP